jgi:glycosyltransferase involved in cell wall biosynthesis
MLRWKRLTAASLSLPRRTGGVLEFVVHEHNGLICKPDAKAVAESLDRLYSDRKLVELLGSESKQTIKALRIDWDNVIEHLFA